MVFKIIGVPAGMHATVTKLLLYWEFSLEGGRSGKEGTETVSTLYSYSLSNLTSGPTKVCSVCCVSSSKRVSFLSGNRRFLHCIFASKISGKGLQLSSLA